MLYIRADAIQATGSGHVMRCLALALWARQMNLPVRMAGIVEIPWVAEKLQGTGIDFAPLPNNSATTSIFLSTIKNLNTNDWIVLDGYHFDTEIQKGIKKKGYKLLVIDDYAHLPAYECNLLLNQNIGAEKLHYSGNIDAILAGSEFALLRPEFTDVQLPDFPKRDTLNLLITLGGGDSEPYLKQLCEELARVNLANVELCFLAGDMRDTVIHYNIRQVDTKVKIFRNVQNMASFLRDMDLCITAGGSTCWELCCLGIPFLPFSIAKNQENIVRELVERNYCFQFTSQNLSDLLENAELRVRQSNKIHTLISGFGAKKVLQKMYAI